MTLLDDFEARHKLLGNQIVNAMLDRVPLSLLNRTGVSELILGVWFSLFLWSCACSNAYLGPKSRAHVPPLAFHACYTECGDPCSGEPHERYTEGCL